MKTNWSRICLRLVSGVILLSPLYVIRWKYFGILPTTLLELLLWVSVGVWLVEKVRRRAFSFPRTGFDGPILLLLVGATLSIWVSPDLRGALGVWKAYFIEPAIFYYLLVDLFLGRDNYSEKLLSRWVERPLLGVAFWLSILGILQFLLHWPIFTPHQQDRAHAVFNNGNALALFVAPILVWLVTSGLGELRWRGLKGGVALVLLTAIFMSKSLGALVALTATIGLALIFKKLVGVVWVKQVWKNLPLILLVLNIVGLTQVKRFAPAVDNPWQRPGGTTLVRLCLWGGTWNLLRDHPFWGAGLSGFKELYGARYYTCDAEPLEYPHSFFLNFWVETGLLGLVAVTWLLWRVFRLSSTHREWRVMSLQLVFFYWIIHGLVDVPYFKNDLALLWFVFLALLAVRFNQVGWGEASGEGLEEGS